MIGITTGTGFASLFWPKATRRKKTGIRAYLAQHGYKVAAVTMSFGDYQWNEPHARCKAKGVEKSHRIA